MQNDELLAAKDDLNQTCVILEGRMLEAERLAEEKDVQLGKLSEQLEERNLALEKALRDLAALETKNLDLQEMVSLLRQQSQTNQDIAGETEAQLNRKISELEDRHFRILEQKEKSDSELDTIRSECKQLLDLNRVLSQQVAIYVFPFWPKLRTQCHPKST
jgi:cobyrinic acid a,c-diamide synthase